MSQNTAILEHLEAGNHLSPMEALHKFGTWALSSRVAELNKRGIKEGFHISCKIVTSNGKSFGDYFIAPSIKVEVEPTGQFSFA